MLQSIEGVYYYLNNIVYSGIRRIVGCTAQRLAVVVAGDAQLTFFGSALTFSSSLLQPPSRAS